MPRPVSALVATAMTKLPILSFRRPSRLLRRGAALALTGQLLSGVPPVFAQDLTLSLASAGTRAWADLARQVQNARVRVNRTVPNVAPPANLDVAFGPEPTTVAIAEARLFAERLVPTAEPTPAQNAAMARLLEAFARTTPERRLVLLQDAMRDWVASPWRAALLTNGAALFKAAGHFTRASDYWRQAWEIGRDHPDPRVQRQAEYALGEHLQTLVTFGQVERLETDLRLAEGRDVRGLAGRRVAEAREALAVLRTQHETAIFSGPESLKALLTLRPIANLEAAYRAVAAYHPSSSSGTTIAELRTLGGSVGLALELRRADIVSDVPTPSIVHLRSQHFSAVAEYRDGKYRMRDPALGGDFWMDAAALRDEMSGFVLVDPSAQLGAGWRRAGDAEGTVVVGRCFPGVPADDPECPDCGGGGPGPGGTPSYSFHPTMASLLINDQPLGYAPAVGPDMTFRLTYHQRTGKIPQTFGYGHVGSLWTHNWLSYVTDNLFSVTPPNEVWNVYLRGNGYEAYSSFDPIDPLSRAALVKVTSSPIRYERRLPDGTVEVFTVPDRAETLPARRVFLSSIVDPQGLTVTFTYDSQFRLAAVTDALGQVTTLDYLDAADPTRLTKVTDPFGRFATIGYDSSGRIASLTDVIGLTASFTYDVGDFIAAMTTPYGTTTFRQEGGNPGTPDPNYRRIDATDPLGATERLEFHRTSTALPAQAPAGEVPTGFTVANDYLHWYNTFYWTKEAMAVAPGDLGSAVITNWLQGSKLSYGAAQSRNVPHSIQRPLESRVWYRYPDQPANHHGSGMGTAPSLTGRVLEGGVSQVTAATYNAQGMVTANTDALGRQMTYTYAGNGLDLLEVRQVRTGGGTDLLQSYANYANHLSGTTTDGAGQTTTITYNARGQALTITNAKNETTTNTYDAVTGVMLTTTGPVTGKTTTFTYDGYGRPQTVTEPDGYAVTTAYDTLNRVTSVTYPDNSTETRTYSRLDLTEQKDRLGRVTRHFYDGFGRRIATRDPAGRTIQQVWCDCGSLEALVDANGNRTTWERDIQGRVTREVRADNVTDTLYTYDLIGRLKTVTDPKDQVTTHTYALDDALLSRVYTNAQIATPSVSYTYEPDYPRVATMVDGIGTTTYGYKAAGTLGAGQVASEDGPLTDDTITYTYDQLGRVVTRAINGAANTVTWTFDALGRVTTEANLLGTFTYAYDGVTSRLAAVTYPNNQTSTYTYLPTTQDHRLQTIHHKYPNGSTLSKFDYTYDAVGNIRTWRQQADTTAVLWKYGYDAADQLTRAVKHATDAQESILQRYGYAYDPAGNRTLEQIDDSVTLSSYDNLNRLTAQAPGGPLVVAGLLNEPGTVTIAGVPTTVDATNGFRGTVPTVAGVNTFTVVARDAAGNQTSQAFEVEVVGQSRSFTFDANGNVASDGTTTFEWDARNQLVTAIVGTHRFESVFDGQQRRIRAIERLNGSVQSETTVLWCEQDTCEERSADGSTVTRRSFAQGDWVIGTGRYFVADHLDSVTEVTDESAVVLGRYAFDPWGRRTVVSGTDATSVGYTSHRESAEGWAAWLRTYDARTARWLSEDPVGMADSTNRYQYAQNNPIAFSDPTGAITVNFDGPKYHPVSDWNELTRKCNLKMTYACTRTRMGTDCKCSGDPCGKWSASVTIQASIDVYMLDGRPYSLEHLRNEENKHVMMSMSVLDKRIAAGKALEAKTFGSKFACEFSCRVFKAASRFTMMYYSPWVHIATPHKY